jgi:hypothetical protein
VPPVPAKEQPAAASAASAASAGASLLPFKSVSSR